MQSTEADLIIIHQVFLGKAVQLLLECRHVEELNCLLLGHKREPSDSQVSRLRATASGHGVLDFIQGMKAFTSVQREGGADGNVPDTLNYADMKANSIRCRRYHGS